LLPPKERSGLSVCADRAQHALLPLVPGGDPKKEIPRAKKTKSHPKNRSSKSTAGSKKKKTKVKITFWPAATNPHQLPPHPRRRTHPADDDNRKKKETPKKIPPPGIEPGS
jgi:hypothetical protein